MGTKKMGRPPVETPKNEQIKIRVYKADKELLHKVCKENNLTQYDVLMTGIQAVNKK